MNHDDFLLLLTRNNAEMDLLLGQLDHPGLLSQKAPESGNQGWTILEILEHILLTEYSIYSMLLSANGTISEQQEIFGKERMEKALIDKRDRKAIAPEYLHPKGVLQDSADFRQQFISLRSKLQQAVQSAALEPYNRVFTHPRLGNLTIIDWLYFLIRHTQRHILQIQDIIQAHSPENQ
jgi:uncharacterized damage-inducible protein DinB